MSTREPASYPSMSRRRRSRRRLGLIAFLAACVALISLELLFTVSAASDSGCGFCHVPSVAAQDLGRSPHSKTSCSACHKLPGAFGSLRYNLQAADNLIRWVFHQPTEVSSPASFAEAGCPRCHDELEDRVSTVASVRMNHKQVLESSESGARRVAVVPCTSCHPDATHSRGPKSLNGPDSHSICLNCHDGLTASRACDTCHVSAAPAQPANASESVQPHPAGWMDSHGMGDQSTCSLCHPGTFCRRCHKVSLPHDPESYMYTHGEEAASAGKSCLSCHDQATCEDCHGLPMPHADNYLQDHDQDATARGTETCETCHAAEGCAACHLQHLHPGVPDSVKQKVAGQGQRSGGSYPPDQSTTSTVRPGP